MTANYNYFEYTERRCLCASLLSIHFPIVCPSHSTSYCLSLPSSCWTWLSTFPSVCLIRHLCRLVVFYIAFLVIMVCRGLFWSACGPVLVILLPVVVQCGLIIYCGLLWPLYGLSWSIVIISHTPLIVLIVLSCPLLLLVEVIHRAVELMR